MSEVLEGVVRTYVERVRVALADLPAEEVDDLTGGMEADLAEVEKECGDLVARLGDPEAYAAELRSAAGLPPRTVAQEGARPSLSSRAAVWVRTQGRRILTVAPWLRELRATWWVARGGLAGLLLSRGAFRDLSGRSAVLLVLLCAAASFAVGRLQHRLPVIVRGGIVGLGVLALVAAAYAGTDLVPRRTEVVYESYPGDTVPPLSNGAVVNGEAATNLYVYGPDGRRIDRVRIFNQYGQAVAVDGEVLRAWWSSQDSNGFAPVDPETGVAKANLQVFPVRWGTRTGWEVSSGEWLPPVQIVPLADLPGAAAPAPSALPSPTASR